MRLRDMPAVGTPENSWAPVTSFNADVRNGPVLKRIGVPGGYLYMTETLDLHQLRSFTLVFVAADRS